MIYKTVFQHFRPSGILRKHYRTCPSISIGNLLAGNVECVILRVVGIEMNEVEEVLVFVVGNLTLFHQRLESFT